MKKIKATDLLAEELEEEGIEKIFGVQGGAVVHIFDSIHEKTNIDVVYTHHEQSAGLAANAYSKRNNGIGVCVVTTGPATTNAMTGLLAAWQDSTAVIYISGQTRKEQTSYGKGLRQVGSQECNILDVVKPWCKYTKLVDDVKQIEETIREAIIVSKEGRPGPVWIDIPVNIQWQEVERSETKFTKVKESKDMSNEMRELMESIEKAERPVVVLGRARYDTDILDKFLKLLKEKNIPIVTTWGSAGFVKDRCTSAGLLGVSGQPSANWAVRDSDVVLFLANHFSITQRGGDYKALNKNQKRYHINTDIDEINNVCSLLNGGKGIVYEVNMFMKSWIEEFGRRKIERSRWLTWRERVSKVTEDLSPKKAYKLRKFDEINPFEFIIKLYSKMDSNDLVVIDGGGCALYAGFQCIPAECSFDVICSSSISAMGTGLPETIGSADENDKNKICIIGDGSLMFNIQELQTIKTNLKSCSIIVLNNKGYQAIRLTQKGFLESRYYGTSEGKGGVEIPKIEKIAGTFGYEYIRVGKEQQLEEQLEKIISNRDKHQLVELIVDQDHENLYSAFFLENKDGTRSQQQLHIMEPFEDYIYPVEK